MPSVLLSHAGGNGPVTERWGLGQHLNPCSMAPDSVLLGRESHLLEICKKTLIWARFSQS